MKILAESLQQYLRFTEKGDPIKDMGIGSENMIRSWLKKHALLDNKSYNLDKNLNISIIYGTIDLSAQKFKKLPEYINFESVMGGFYINNNELKDLKGCPNYVSGSFICSYNKLENLIDCPISIGQGFFAISNKLISLEGLPSKMKSLGLSNNLLKNLKGIPKIIEGDLYIGNNPIETLEYFPERINGNIYYSETDIVNQKTIEERCSVEGLFNIVT